MSRIPRRASFVRHESPLHQSTEGAQVPLPGVSGSSGLARRRADRASGTFPSLARALIVLSMCGFAGCATLGLGGADGAEEPKTPAQVLLEKIEARLAALDKRIGDLEKGAHAQRKEFAHFQHELQDTRNQLLVVRRGVELDARRKRSGLAMDLDPAAAVRIEAEQAFGDHAVEIPPASGAETRSLAEEPLPDNASPARLTDDAEERMRLARYGEAVVLLSDVQQRWPHFDDGGRSLLLLAESWVKLGEPQNALPAVRQMYARFPTSFRLPSAKIVEARAQEKLGARQKALTLYREVLSTHPDEAPGQEARAALARLRDEP